MVRYNTGEIKGYDSYHMALYFDSRNKIKQNK